MVMMFREDRDSRNIRTKSWHRGNPSRSYWLAAKGRARRQGLPFDLLPEDLIFPDTCPVLGIPLSFTSGGRTDNTPSLDKVVAEKGYVRGNVRVISWKANRLKGSATLEELKKLVEYIEKA